MSPSARRRLHDLLDAFLDELEDGSETRAPRRKRHVAIPAKPETDELTRRRAAEALRKAGFASNRSA